MRTRDPEKLVEAARSGDRSALARLLSFVEQGGELARSVGRLTHPLGGESYTVGITGAPGAGKSTLTSAMIGTMRDADLKVAVLAIDPSSPFSGGAILGDRVRMQDHVLDDHVFIRSMATRGHLGGLALATPEAVRVLDAARHPWVLIETVGVGQVEVDVAGATDTTVVVVNPGWGDSVQANKAGLMEIADIFVINKADRNGVDQTRRDLEQMLELSTLGSWTPPILATVAADEGKGVEVLWETIGEHRAHLEATSELEGHRAARLDDELHRIIVEQLRERANALATTDDFAEFTARILQREVDPWSASDHLLGLPLGDHRG